MANKKIRIIDIIFWIAVIAFDLFVYIILGILQMDYDDNWDESKGEYWSLKSINTIQLIFFFALQLWNLINIIVIFYIGRKIYKRIRNKTQ